MGKTLEVEVHWYPQPKQAALLEAAGLLACVRGEGGPTPPKAPIIGYGGAAYGGKTDGQIGLAIAAAFAYPGVNIGFVRRTYPELNMLGGAIKRSQELLAGVTVYNMGEHTHTFPNGSRLQFIYAQNEADVLKYKSSQYDVLLIDEATTFTWYMVDYLMTRNRATISGIQPFTVMTTNPGDVGHSWYMQLFDTVNAHGPHEQVKVLENPNGRQSTVYFIPAFLSDNTIGLQRDPGYADRLAASDPETARALLAGDWTIFAGQAFPQWRYDRHVRPYSELPDDWPTWRSMDYGWEHPYFCYWWKRDPSTGRHYVIRELHGTRMNDKEIAEAIKTATLPNERVLFTFASPDMWRAQRADNIVTTAPDTFRKYGIILTKADDARVNGKRKINNLLAPLPDGEPGLVVFDTCTELIKVMPTLVRDPKNPEDVLKVDGDDAYDAARYGLTNYQLPASQPAQARGAETRKLVREVFA
jgi:phage terminase large subunit